MSTIGRLAVIVPTVTPHGLLDDCLRSIRDQRGVTTDILIVQNDRRRRLDCSLWEARGASVHRARRNLGVAASWNLGARWAWRRGHDAVLLVNDDIELVDPETLQRFRTAVDGEPRSLYFLVGRGFGVGCLTRTVWDEVGPFDEGFWPAYHEDNDFHRRARLRGIPARDIEGESAHYGSATIRVDTAFEALNRRTFPLTQERYIRKWGGLPDQETFDRPWNGATAAPSVRVLSGADTVPGGDPPRRRAARRKNGVLVVVGALNQLGLLADGLGRLLDLSNGADIAVIDNGSDPPIASERWIPTDVRVVRNRQNIGCYPLFAQGLELGRTYDVIAFLHSDLIVHERGWDDRIREAFASDERLGLVGFVGSSELDAQGGRGLGTMLNFQGVGRGSPAEAHGRRIADLRPAVVVDGCAMAFRREALAEIGSRADFPPHHFYDRLMSCQVLERGWRVAVLGVACDHLGNRTVSRETAWHELARRWAQAHGIAVGDGNWDLAIYLEAERQFLGEWRDRKRFVPVRVEPDWTLQRTP
jgi:GT2 family glycosyltransferase